ncbi:MAG: capsular biosynthesis protein, partial [Deltaproteobacteria bacterium]|nr:capsular biosynthesis protein [Deltaproteobacteria bacterium]
LTLSRLADGVIMVIWGGVTGRDIIRKANQSLAGVNAKITGVALNNINMAKLSSYQYYYPYYHSYTIDEGGNKKA